MRKNWIIKSSDTDSGRLISSETGVSRVLACILASRGYESPDAALEFMEPAHTEKRDPMLMTDMEIAVKRIRQAVESGETVGIMGDYDVDGITATAILYKYFTRLGINTVYHIPSRDGEGYGISTSTLSKLKESGCSLVISVDCGITAIKEAEFCKEIGLDMIITDHHEVGEVIPDCVAVVNPKRPNDAYQYPKLSGVGVAYKLVTALGITDHYEEYTAFAALGTLADMMPVTGENRAIITDGMRYIRNGVNVGLSQLMEKAGVAQERFNSFSVSFILAPRMNAAGRMEKAETALKLLLEDDEYAASLIAEKLCALNKTRQETEAQIFRRAVEMVESDPSYNDDKIIVLYDGEWHQGVVGIVAAKITEKYEKPTILFTCANGSGKGSGRSVSGFSIHKAVCGCSDLLTKFGGHEYAVGLGIEVENIPAFRKRINEITSDIEISPKTLDIDVELFPDELSLDTVHELSRLEPYGEGNPQPVFVLRDMRLAYMKIVGEKHTRLSLRDAKYSYDAIYYNVIPNMLDVSVGDYVDIVFTLGINEYNGQENLQIVVKDISYTGELELALDKLEKIKADGKLENRSDLPEFADFECVYLAIARGGEINIRPELFAAELSKKSGRDISVIKLMVIISVFRELSLIDVGISGGTLVLSVVKGAQKTELDNSELFRRLKNHDRN